MFYKDIELSDMYKFLFDTTKFVTERKVNTIIIGDNNSFSHGGRIETLTNLGHRKLRLEFTEKGEVNTLEGGLREADLMAIQTKWREFLDVK